MGLNSRIEILARDPGRDALGQPLKTWHSFRRLWAEPRHVSGLEAIRAGADTSLVKASFKINRNALITAAMRVRTDIGLYEINAVLPDEMGRQYSFLVCTLVK